MTLLDVTDLSVSRLSGQRPVRAVQPVSFTIEPGETLGLLGEVGSGADLVARAVAGVATGGDVAGSVLFEGRDLLTLSERELRKLREVDIGLLLTEAPGSRRPGGRAAPALPPQPKLLVVDTGDADLDEGLGELIRRLQADAQTAVLIVTRDLVALADLTDLVIEMYAGKPVEFADGRELTYRPHHPYTTAVVTGLPLRGSAPAPGAQPTGCPFHPRCPYVMDRCVAEEPPPRALGPGGHHRSACWLPLELVGVDADVALRREQAASAGRAGTTASAPQIEAGPAAQPVAADPSAGPGPAAVVRTRRAGSPAPPARPRSRSATPTSSSASKARTKTAAKSSAPTKPSKAAATGAKAVSNTPAKTPAKTTAKRAAKRPTTKSAAPRRTAAAPPPD